MPRSAEHLGSADDSYLDFEIPQRRPSKKLLETRGPWPEARIIRTVSIEPGDNMELQALVNVLGRRNHGKGKAPAVGSMALTIVDATEMGRMLERKYPKVYENRRKTIQLQHRLARQYQGFVRASRANLDDDVFADMTAELGAGDVDVPELDDQIWSSPTEDDGSWAPGAFGVYRFHPYASNHLGLDMSTNEALANEFESTLLFLRSEGLDTSVVDQARSPHVVVFETYGALGATVLQGTRPPAMVMLDAPSMHVNSNEPAQQGHNLL